MAHTSPLTGSRLPDLADAPNGPQAFSNSTLDLEDNCIVRGTTASDRDAKFTAWTAAGNTLTSGLTSFTQNDGRYWRYDTASSSWLYAGGNPPPIVACTAAAGWTNATSNAPGAYRDSSGLIHLIGGVQPQTTYNPQDGGTHTAVNLPSGFFPAASLRTFPIPVPNASAIVVGQISTAGVLSIVGGTTGSIGANLVHYLDGVTFHPTHNNSVPFA